MRFLIHEKAYEMPVASGLLRYERDGQATGTEEAWRLAKTTSGETILRVDFDARASVGSSYLYHLLLDKNQQPQRLTYRYLDDKNRALSGNILFAEDGMVNNRKIAADYRDQEIAPRPFFFPTTIGLGWLARQRVHETVATLDIESGFEDPHFMSLMTITPSFKPQRTRDIKRVAVRGQTYPATTLAIAWADQSYQLWLTLGERWPLRMQRSDGLSAIETRYLSYSNSAEKSPPSP